MFTDLFQQLQANSLILTPNKRMAARLHEAYAEYQVKLGKTAWETLKVLPISAWLMECWQILSFQGDAGERILLNTQQSQSLWESIIHEDARDALLQLSSTVTYAQSAYQLCKQYLIDLNDERLQETQESCAFVVWAKAYEATCKEKGFIDAACLSDIVLNAFQDVKLSPPEEIVLLNFTEFNPSLQALLRHCKEQAPLRHCEERSDAAIQSFNSKLLKTKTEQASFQDQQTEILAMTNWAKDLYNKNPTAKIACIVPSLHSLRPQLETQFYETFELDRQVTGNLPFSFSAGQALSDTPAIYSALTALNLLLPQIDMDDLSHILRSPFFADSETESDSRALFDRELKNLKQTTINTEALSSLLEANSPSSLRGEAVAIQSPSKCREATTDSNTGLLRHFVPRNDEGETIFRKDVTGKQSASEWAKHFSEHLCTLGWPGERSLNSAEFQATQHWLKLLDQFASLDLLGKKLTLKQAISKLGQMARSSIFQTQSINPRIHVLGLLEAAGIPFDHAWIMGMDNKTWPTPAQPNPFLPIHLQIECNMPHASAARELDFCQTLTTQLLENTPDVICSFAEMVDDQARSASPLIPRHCDNSPPRHCERSAAIQSQNKCREATADSNTGLPRHFVPRNDEMETFEDSKAPNIQTDEKIRGGTAIFKKQAACPFRAFAEYRLNAKQTETPELGIDARTRGSIAHKALELIWKRIETQANLLTLSETELNDCINEAIELALSELNDSPIMNALKQLETKRLRKLLQDWLAQEKNREDFKVIAREQWQSAKIGPLDINVQVDRIDRLKNGDDVLIDYKTGKTNINDWFGERPNDPQLPLYTIIHKEPVAAIAFAQLRVDELRFKGVKQEGIEIPGCKPLGKVNDSEESWQAQLNEWQEQLTQLANDFADGDAAVDPKEAEKTCQFCHLQTLCRIHDPS